ncbi:substrate-binding domain-containing protein [Sphingomonas sp.]|uniref:substrate-binding domain-containing protein n=1 Tax=Sphingomonas sp. TaxID=28214 RepID=UPI003CC5A65E
MTRGGKATSFDIAELAGVSQPTVSRALRGDSTVSEATRLRVRAVAQQLHYTVDKNASALRRGRSNTLALLFFEDPLPNRSLINPFFLAMLGSMLRTCAERGYDLLTSFQRMDSDWQAEWEDSRKADGLILLGHGDFEQYRERLDGLVRRGTHFVRWGSPDAAADGITVGCDNLAGGRAAGERLLALGRRRLVFLGEASDSYPEFRDRDAGLRQAIAAAPGGAIVARADAISTEEAGETAAQRLLASGVAFDGLFAASDLIALGALRALAAAGLRVPDDVAVIGFDDIPAASSSSPPLTTVAQDYARAGEVLVETLIALLDAQPTADVLLPPRLVLRGTA